MKKAKVSQFKQDPQNLNLGNDKGNAILQQSIQELGAGRSILVDKNGFIIAGNKTAQAALNEGLDDAIIVETAGDKLVVVQRTDLDLSTDPRAKQLAIADNRVAEINLEWDTEALKELATEIDLSWLEIDNSFIEELEKIAEANNAEELEREEGLTDEDEVPDDADVETRVKKGDVWQLGRHRVMCGDSTFIDDVDKLMDGKKADMVFTDPPYNINFKPQRGTHGAIENDNMDTEDFKTWLSDVFNLVYQNQKNDSFSIVWCGWSTIEQFHPVLKQMYDVKSLHIWVKNNFGIGYYSRPKYEPFFLLLKGSPPVPEKAPADVWEFAKVHKTIHSCEKPVGLIEEIFSYYSQSKELVIDVFLGSGSTLIACEKTGRTCYGMELSEKYCDVILKRWEDFTGKTAVLVKD